MCDNVEGRLVAFAKEIKCALDAATMRGATGVVAATFSHRRRTIDDGTNDDATAKDFVRD